ncbi:MAG: GNAT family N-acetyltransferase [Chloroflexi bacterium]|nr:GNAT family N-acetyltransferase [Chloroflexota bacterium]
MGKRERVIRPLQTEAEWDQYITIGNNAYPGASVSGEAARRRYKERGQKMDADPIIHIYALFEADEMQGIFRLYDFTMRLHNKEMLVGGIGGIGVDLLHKKERVAYDMMQFFLTHYHKKGAALATLYPFRPDFYRQMGFGYGRKMNQYRFHPANLPDGKRQNVTYLNATHRQALDDCYRRVMAARNGLMAHSDFALEMTFAAPTLQKVGYWQDGQLRGYLLFVFEPVSNGNFLRNNILVRTLIYENVEALRGLLAFLRVQADQIETIIFNTQDEDFHLLLHDPRNDSHNLMSPVYHESNTQGVGIMYRVIDVPRLFDLLADHNFGGQSCVVQLNLTDSFWPLNAGSWQLVVNNGRASIQPNAQPEVEIGLDIAEFSSLITGAITFRQLLAYGLVTISDTAYADKVHQIFYTSHKPYCFTPF